MVFGEMENTQKWDAEINGIFFGKEIIFVGIILVGQISLHDGCDLSTVILDSLHADVLDIVQIGVIMIDVCHRREVETWYGISHDVEISAVGHLLIDQIGERVGKRALGIFGIKLYQPFVAW